MRRSTVSWLLAMVSIAIVCVELHRSKSSQSTTAILSLAKLKLLGGARETIKRGVSEFILMVR
jgi:hypothetical protein